MSITVILDMKIHAELLEEFLSGLAANMPATLEFDGCEYVDVYQTDDDNSRVVCVEGWTSLERFQAYGAWRVELGDAEKFQKYYDGPPSLTRLVATTGM